MTDLLDTHVINNVVEQLKKLNKIDITDVNLPTHFNLLTNFYNQIKKDFTINRINILSVMCSNKNIEHVSGELISCLSNLDTYYDIARNIFNSFSNTISLCHGDMHYENLINTDNGVSLIDFDFCSLNNPEYDYVNMYEETLIADSNEIQIEYILTFVDTKNIVSLQIYNNIFWMAWVLAKLTYCTKNHIDFINYLILRIYRLTNRIQSSSAHELVNAVKPSS